jgi:hypothetical protein
LLLREAAGISTKPSSRVEAVHALIQVSRRVTNAAKSCADLPQVHIGFGFRQLAHLPVFFGYPALADRIKSHGTSVLGRGLVHDRHLRRERLDRLFQRPNGIENPVSVRMADNGSL